MPTRIPVSVTPEREHDISRRFATSRTLPPMVHCRASRTLRSAAAACLYTALLLLVPPALAAPSQLAFQVREGRIFNYFLRQGPVAAHLLLRSGPQPRILIAFPAGNSGVGLWFAHRAGTAAWQLRGEPQPVHARDAKGRALYGITAEATLADPALEIRGAVLSNIRVLRDYESLGTVPKGVAVRPSVTARSLVWSRDRLDGAAGYRLTIEVLDGRVSGKRIRAGADGRIGLRITA